MTKAQIGFTPEPPTLETWEKKFGDLRVEYSKEETVNGHFLYNCKCWRQYDAAATSWASEGLGLTHDEVECIPRFVDLVNSRRG